MTGEDWYGDLFSRRSRSVVDRQEREAAKGGKSSGRANASRLDASRFNLAQLGSHMTKLQWGVAKLRVHLNRLHYCSTCQGVSITEDCPTLSPLSTSTSALEAASLLAQGGPLQTPQTSPAHRGPFVRCSDELNFVSLEYS